ncbi:MAG: RluA family pseudouridine synthase [Candidatus Latescibacterota bacterium]|nr:MAG: RluA family pseudouridine synthase [Candidatus Latescibacterota bacterium]
MPLDVLYEDNHLLGVCKPAGLLVQGDRTGDPTLVDAVSDYLRQRWAKPGRVYVGVVHRLDRPASGVLLLARTSKAAARLSEHFRRGLVHKRYVALVERAPQPPRGTLEHHLVKDPATNRTRVTHPGAPGARFARLHYRTIETRAAGALVEVELETGRSHQIRVQLADVGAVIVGDVRYGSKRQLGPMIALHATRLEVAHPTRDERVRLEAPLPASWATLLPE